MGYAANLTLVAVLLAATAFFVATEFAIIKIRPSRVDQLVLEGRKNALAIQRVQHNLDGYLSACQLGITITALGLGWLGEPTVADLLHPLFAHFGLSPAVNKTLSFLIAFSLITYVHVVLGELAPKTAAIHKAEWISLKAAPIIIRFYQLMFPFIWLLNGSANRLVRLFGMEPAQEHEEAPSEEELRLILAESYKSGKINKSEYGYVNRIFAFDDLIAREIMVPRIDMICLYAEHSLEEHLQTIRTEQYTRFPVVKGNKDNIIGMVNTKQFFLKYDQPGFRFEDLIHPVLSVSEATPVNKLLKMMQAEETHLAILVDEYGGTSGMVTIEDILEEIVGEIRDEFDTDESREIQQLGEGHFLFDGKVTLDEVNNLLGSDIESEDLGTIGGWVYHLNPELRKGVEWRYRDLSILIREKDRHRIRKVELRRLPKSEAEDAADGDEDEQERTPVGSVPEITPRHRKRPRTT